MDKKSFAIGTIIGTAIGAAGMFFVMRYKMSDDLAEMTDKMREYYQKKYGQIPDPNATAKTEKTNPVEELPKQEEPMNQNTHSIDYTKYTRPIPFNIESVPAEDGDASEYVADLGDGDNTKPYSIPPDEYDSDNGFKKIYLTWYEKNRVLAYNSNPHITLDPDEWDNLVGDFENHFDDWERYSVYMRNEVDRVDYAIDACSTNYNEMIKVVRDDRFDKEDDED